jgi:ABC-2 type transport system ATP-binding protein
MSVAPIAGRRRARPATVQPEPPIRTRALTKHYEQRIAVDHLDLDVLPGEIFGLLGQNGAGKTTTILMLLGLTEPSGGHARVLGMDPARHPLEVKRRVGYLPDAVGFYGNLTGRQNLRYTARLNGLDRSYAEARIDETLDQVALADRADSRTDTYSRGMLQRLGIADALLKDPEILILDEPTTAIDPIGVVEILRLLRRLVEDEGMTILLSSHLLSQVQSVCDRVGIFAGGRLIGVGTVDELAHRFGDESAHVRLEVDPLASVDEDTLERRIRAIDGVGDVHRPETVGGAWDVVVRPPDEREAVRRALVRLMADEDLPIVGIAAQVPSLDEIYRHAVAASLASGETAA